jgi:hypothetical protein
MESRVQGRKQLILAQGIQDSTRGSRLPADKLNYMTAYSSRVN